MTGALNAWSQIYLCEAARRRTVAPRKPSKFSSMLRSISWRYFDFWLLGAVVLATAFGTTMIRSAVAGNEELVPLINRQIYFAAGGAGSSSSWWPPLIIIIGWRCIAPFFWS